MSALGTQNGSLADKMKHYRLSDSEYRLMCDLLQREPQGIEWALFSALWSEHCSYKSSRLHLKKMAWKSDRVLESFGENAGVVDLGEGERVAFKMESHNHPSFIEPYQGAATGVGGILRDIFTMGARPIALANFLCFGEPQADRMPQLVDGVVRGIAGYGNCVGVPTITGQTEFHASYNKNILVNAMAVGLFAPGEKIVNSRARGLGNKIVYVGAKTGRDGVHGASMASESFDQKSERKLPTIQIGDPFFEKLLIESCLEVFRSDLVVAIQDMGAAGLTSSSFEMAAKGQVGFRIELDKVPLRDSTLTPEDILLSESQERMLLIAEPKNLPAIAKIFSKYGLDAAVIGEIVAGTDVELVWHGETLTKIDPQLLTEQAPLYDRPFHRSELAPQKTLAATGRSVRSDDSTKLLLDVLSDVGGCSRAFVFGQYDQNVGARTVRDCRSPVGVLKLPSDRYLGIVTSCRPHIMRLHAGLGARDAVAMAHLQLSVLGFQPLALTDCLNYASPEDPKTMGHLVASVEALATSSRDFGTPVISGNVSLYNESSSPNGPQPITPTPSIGMVGLRAMQPHLPRNGFTHEGDKIYLIKNSQVRTTGLLAEKNNSRPEFTGDLSTPDLAAWGERLRAIALSGHVHAVRVVGNWGLAYALARMTSLEYGCRVMDLSFDDLFVETLYEILVTGGKELAGVLAKNNLDFTELGTVVTGVFEIGRRIVTSTDEIQRSYLGGFGEHFGKLS
jgi:phosphoribosylformylglycinamidine synthase